MTINFALFAQDVYNRETGLEVGTNQPDLIALGVEIGETKFNGAEIVGRAETSQGFYAIAYDTGEEIIVSYRGTDGVLKDAINGWSGGAGQWDAPQFKSALEFFHAVSGVYEESNKPIVLTGHSLGGGLAGFVSSITGASAHVFDNMTYELSAKMTYALARIKEEFGDIPQGIAALPPNDIQNILGTELAELGLTVGSDETGLFLNPGILGFAKQPITDQTVTDALSYYGGQSASPVNTASVAQYAVVGEALNVLRKLADTDQDTNDVDAYFGGGYRLDINEVYELIGEGTKGFADGAMKGWVGGPKAALVAGLYSAAESVGRELIGDLINVTVELMVNKHSMSLMTANLYLDANYSEAEREDIGFLGGAIFSHLFDDTVANRIGITSGDEGEAAARLFSEIAYSAATGENNEHTPFGTTALAAMFNDARDAGQILEDAEYNFNLGTTTSNYEIRGALGGSVVQFAGELAHSQNMSDEMDDGFIRTHGNRLISVDYSEALWAEASGDATYDVLNITGRTLVIDRFDYDDYFNLESIGDNVDDAMNQLWGDGTSDVFERVHFINTDGLNSGITTNLANIHSDITIEGATVASGSSNGDVIAGTDFGDTITGSARNELIDGGAGSDRLYGGAGNDILVASAGNDEADSLDGGDGTDIVVFSRDWDNYRIATLPLSINYDYLVEEITFGYIATGNQVYLNDIEFAVFDGGITYQLSTSSFYQKDVFDGSDAMSLSGGVGTDSLDLLFERSAIIRTVGGDSWSHNLGSFSVSTSSNQFPNVYLTSGSSAADIESFLTAGEAGIDYVSYGSPYFTTTNYIWNTGYWRDRELTISNDFEIMNITGSISNDAILFTGVSGHYDGGTGDNDLFIADWSQVAQNIVWELTPLVETSPVSDVSVEGFERLHLRLGSGGDEILAGEANDFINGGDGNDTINGGEGNDTIDGGEGEDHITGNGQLIGGLGDDIIVGTGDLHGGADNDIITHTSGGGTAFGEDGNDAVSASYNGSTLSVSGGVGTDSLDLLFERSAIIRTVGGDSWSHNLGSFSVSTSSNQFPNVYLTSGSSAADIESFLTAGEAGIDYVSYGSPYFTTTNYIWNTGYWRDRELTISNDFEIMNITGSISNDAILFTGVSGHYDGGTGDNDLFIADWSQVAQNIVWELTPLVETSPVSDVSVEGFERLHLRLGSGGDEILAGEANDFINGGDGNDTINGGEGNDTIDGGEGEDHITGNGQLIGGLGDDIIVGTGDLHGGADNDIITHTSGGGTAFGEDGNDAVSASYNGSTLSVSGGVGTDSLDLLFERSAIIRTVGGDSWSHNLGSFSVSTSSNQFPNVYLTSGSSAADIESFLTAGEAGIDYVSYGSPYFTTTNYIWNTGYWRDRELTISNDFEIMNITGSISNDAILFTGVSGHYDGGTGDNDLFIADWSQVAQNIVWELTPLVETSPVSDVSVEGFERLHLRLGSGGDEILAGEANDFINGGDGNDTINGGLGSDVYVFGADAGLDLVQEVGGAADVLRFEHVTNIEDLGLHRGPQPGSSWEGTLFVTHGENDQVEVKNQFASHGGHLVETLELGNGDQFTMHTGTTGGSNADVVLGRTVVDYLKGNGGNDFLSAGASDDALFGHGGDDILIGGTGDDALRGGHGADRYHIFDGDGADTIIEYDGVTDLTSVDQIIFHDVASLENMDIGRLSLGGSTWEGALHFDMSGGDSLTLLNHFASNGRYVVEELELGDGTTFAMTNQTTGSSTNDLLVGREVVDYLKGQGGDDYLIAGGNDDVLFGHSGNDTLIGETGNDTLRGGDGADRYVLNTGDGDDLIIEYDGIADLTSTDVIVFKDIDDINDLTLSRVAENGSTWAGSLLIEAGTDSVRVQHHFASNDRYKIENIELSDGSIHVIDDFVFV